MPTLNLKPTLLLLFLCTCSIFKIAHAQHFRYYNQGPLSYEDFQAIPLELDSINGTIYFEYKYADTSFHVDGIQFKVNQLFVGVNTRQSWLNIDMTAVKDLLYFQTLYDIEHLYALKYNKAQIENVFDINTDEIQRLNEDKNISINKFKLESSLGSKERIIQKWHQRLTDSISNIQIDKQNYSLKSYYGLDGHIGLGYIQKTNDLKDNFGNNLGLSFALGLNIDRNYIIFSGNLGVGKTSTALPQSPLWEAETRRNDVVFNIGYGRKFSISKFKITPFIGPSLLNIYINRANYEDVYEKLGDTAWHIGGGFHLDFPLADFFEVNTNPFRGYARMYINHGLRISVNYVPPIKLFDEYSGSATSVSLNYYYYFGSMERT